MASERRNEAKVGIFIAIGIALTLLTVWTMGSTQNLFTRRNAYFLVVQDASGISAGAKVTISGVDVGTVESFSLNPAARTVRVAVSIPERFQESLKQDSYAEVVTEGVLGDKLIAITAGSNFSPRLPPGSEIPVQHSPSLQALLGKGDRVATDLSSLISDLDQLVRDVRRQVKPGHIGSSLEKLDRILGKVDRGNGTIGGLLNDPELYDDVKALIGESNENRILRNVVRNSVKGSEAAGQKKQD